MPQSADALRARSWHYDIVQTILGDDVAVRDAGTDWHFRKGLHVHKLTGAWYDFAANLGGHSTELLVQHLRGCAWGPAQDWVHYWLVNYPGYGRCNGADPADDDDSSNALNAVRIAEAVELQRQFVGPPAADGPVTHYLVSRGLHNSAETWLAELPVNIARAGDAALVSLLEAAGRVVGFQLIHLTPAGHKSSLVPLRRRYHLEHSPYTKAATFGAWPVRSQWQAITGDMPVLLVEGVEDTLSLRVAYPGRVVVGVPGVATMANLAVPRGAKVTIVRDGDAPGSPADKGLQAAIDSLLLQGAEVRVTTTPEAQDANDILRGPDGIAVLIALVDAAVPAKLSLPSRIVQLAHQDDYELQPQLAEIAKQELKVQLVWLRKEIARARKQSPPWQLRPGATGPWDTGDQPVQPPVWGGNLAAVLDAGVRQLQRFVITAEPALAVTMLWIAHKHLEANRATEIDRTLHLRPEGPTPGTGKSTFCDVVGELAPSGQHLTSYTASSFARAYHAADTAGAPRPTLLLDETDLSTLRNTVSPELQQLLNGATRRGGAFKSVTEQLADNSRIVVKMDVFGGVLISGIGAAPASLADRSIRVLFQREDATTTEHLDKFFGGDDVHLIEVREQLAAWAASLTAPLATPALSEWLRRHSGRTAGNWMLLLTIAEAAGGRWPGLVKEAARAEFAAERAVHEFERLLASIRRGFADQPEWDGKGAQSVDHRERVETTVLLHFLNERDRTEEWDRAHNGKPVNHYWLRNKLLNQLEPKGAQGWWTGPKGAQTHHRGYLLTQFADAWRRYLTPEAVAPTPPPDDTAATAPPNGSDGHVAPETGPVAQDADAPPSPPSADMAASAADDQTVPPEKANGEPATPFGDFESELAAQRAAHPNWDAKKLAKAMHQPVARVEHYLEQLQ